VKMFAPLRVASRCLVRLEKKEKRRERKKIDQFGNDRHADGSRAVPLPPLLCGGKKGKKKKKKLFCPLSSGRKKKRRREKGKGEGEGVAV